MIYVLFTILRSDINNDTIAEGTEIRSIYTFLFTYDSFSIFCFIIVKHLENELTIKNQH